MTSTRAKSFICELSVDTKEGIVEPGEEISFFDKIDFVKNFWYSEDSVGGEERELDG